jgi:hypothetical protein
MLNPFGTKQLPQSIGADAELNRDVANPLMGVLQGHCLFNGIDHVGIWPGETYGGIPKPNADQPLKHNPLWRVLARKIDAPRRFSLVAIKVDACGVGKSVLEFH